MELQDHWRSFNLNIPKKHHSSTTIAIVLFSYANPLIIIIFHYSTIAITIPFDFLFIFSCTCFLKNYSTPIIVVPPLGCSTLAVVVPFLKFSILTTIIPPPNYSTLIEHVVSFLSYSTITLVVLLNSLFIHNYNCSSFSLLHPNNSIVYLWLL